MSFQVPTVDISPYVTGEGDRAAAATAFDAACREVGFVQVTGHGMADDVVEGLTTAMDEFFALDLGTKLAYRTPPEINRGYSPPRSESLSLSLGVGPAGGNDYFEAFNVGAARSTYGRDDLPADHYAENVWPAEVRGFEARVWTYFTEARRVARTLTRVAADALGLPEGFFDAYLDHSVDVLRMNDYALPPGTVDAGGGPLTGMGAHTDYGIVTVLWADRVPGLQVLGGDGAWHDVQPAEGALLVNLGDLTGRWTNDRWLSTLHRVVPPVVDGTIRRRRSAAFFCDGDVDAVVTTLPQCVGADHPDRYGPVTVGEHLAAKLAGSRAGVPNPNAGRETERLMAGRP